MEYQPIIIALISAVVTFAITWGATSARIKQAEKDVLEMRQNFEVFKEKVVLEKSCLANHLHSDNALKDVKDEINRMNVKLDTLLAR